jgi:type IV pilus assembly protein PilA
LAHLLRTNSQSETTANNATNIHDSPKTRKKREPTMRKYITKKGQAGFTLIELMIVVAIVGILAVLAVYGVRKYIANAKTAEARNSLGQIGKDMSTAFEKESMPGAVLPQSGVAAVSRALCATPSAPVPPGAVDATTVAGRKYQSSQAQWAPAADNVSPVSGFPCMKFAMQDPQYYQYTFTTAARGAAALGAAGTAMVATATGDLDGNGTLSVFTLNGIIQPDNSFSLGPNLVELNPEE